MIGYTTVGTADMDRAKKFYCDLFESKGAKVLVDAGRIAMIGTGRGTPMIAVCEPYNKEAPTPGNGVMVAFTAETKPEVDEFYARAIELGATCDGPPRPTGAGPFLWCICARFRRQQAVLFQVRLIKALPSALRGRQTIDATRCA